MEKLKRKHTEPGWIWGLLLIGLGAFFLLTQTVMATAMLIWMSVMAGIGVVFLAVYLSNRRRWWALIPAYVFGAIAGLLLLAAIGFSNTWIAIYVFAAIAVPFYTVYLRNRENWWALIPAYAMTAIGGLVLLNEAAAVDSSAAYMMFAVAFPFLFVFLRNPKNWWALIPGGILGLIGLGLLFRRLLYLVPTAMIVVGIYLLVRYLGESRAKRTPSAAQRAPAAPEPPAAEFEPIGQRRGVSGPQAERPQE